MTRAALILVGVVALSAPTPAQAKDDVTVVVGSALGWLARHQEPDGSWGSNWAKRCAKGSCPSVERGAHKAKRGKRLHPKLAAKERARRKKYYDKLKAKRKPTVSVKEVERVPADPKAGRRRGHFAVKANVGSRFARVEVAIDLRKVPGSKTRATKITVSFTKLSKSVRYTCQPCKKKHEDPGPCLACGEPVK